MEHIAGELQIEGGILKFQSCGGGMDIVSCRVTGSRVEIPDRIEALPVRKVAQKTFLSAKKLKELRLPAELLEIGDWAFAYCSNLEQVWLPKRELKLGKGIFKGCKALLGIYHLEDEKPEELQAGRLLGTVPERLEADYLFAPQASGTPEWICQYDARLTEFLDAPDEDGYIKMVYCGEEDIMSNMDLYLAGRRREKSELCFLRLLNPVGLEKPMEKKLRGYLAEHTAGCESRAAWETVFEGHGNDQAYYEAFTQSGCLTEENYEEILSQMGDRYPEMKGYLMRYRSKNMSDRDFFDALSLD